MDIEARLERANRAAASRTPEERDALYEKRQQARQLEAERATEARRESLARCRDAMLDARFQLAQQQRRQHEADRAAEAEMERVAEARANL